MQLILYRFLHGHLLHYRYEVFYIILTDNAQNASLLEAKIQSSFLWYFCFRWNAVKWRIAAMNVLINYSVIYEDDSAVCVILSPTASQ